MWSLPALCLFDLKLNHHQSTTLKTTDLVGARLGDVDNASSQFTAQVVDKSHSQVLGLVGDVHVVHATWHCQQ